MCWATVHISVHFWRAHISPYRMAPWIFVKQGLIWCKEHINCPVFIGHRERRRPRHQATDALLLETSLPTIVGRPADFECGAGSSEVTSCLSQTIAGLDFFSPVPLPLAENVSDSLGGVG